MMVLSRKSWRLMSQIMVELEEGQTLPCARQLCTSETTPRFLLVAPSASSEGRD